MRQGEHGIVREQTVGSWLDSLASGDPTPGGGAAAAMSLAVGAALVEMVCNLTIGKPRYADHEPLMRRVQVEASDLRARAVKLAEADANAFAAVAAAYRLPKDDIADRAARTEAIQAALIGAVEVPLSTAAAAAAIIDLTRRVVDGANVNVLSDVAVAAASAAAALDAAAINVEINLAAMKDEERCDMLRAELVEHVGASAVAADVVATVRTRVNA